jgi:hypothetical protein
VAFIQQGKGLPESAATGDSTFAIAAMLIRRGTGDGLEGAVDQRHHFPECDARGSLLKLIAATHAALAA